MSFPVFDLHCDTALKLLGRNYYAEGLLRKNSFHVDLERAMKYPGYCQCFACFTSPLEALPPKITVEDSFERQLAVLLREINGNMDLIQQAYCADDIKANQKAGRMSAVFTIEGPAGFGFDPDLLENMAQIGFRITTLGWNESNQLTGSCKTSEGLTDLGREYVKEAQRVGMLVDVSHISDKGFWDIIDITQAPIIASHSNSRAVLNHHRNLSDDMFLAICQTGGVTGINLGSHFVADNGSLDDVCNHIFHFLELDHSGKHIALGGDLDGVSRLVDGFSGVESYDVLAEKLSLKGLPDHMIADIFWNNAVGVL